MITRALNLIMAVVLVAMVAVAVFGYVAARMRFTQKFELETEAALTHGAERSYLMAEWMEKLDLNGKKDQLIMARSAQSLMMAGEEFLLVYTSGTIDLAEVAVVEVEKQYTLQTAIPGIKVTGTRFLLTKRAGHDGEYVEVVKSDQQDVLYV
jgi:hypothetical protein